MVSTMAMLTIPESLLLKLSPMKLGIGSRQRVPLVGPLNLELGL